MEGLLNDLVYEEKKLTLKERFYNFLLGKGFIKSPNWIFGGK